MSFVADAGRFRMESPVTRNELDSQIDLPEAPMAMPDQDLTPLPRFAMLRAVTSRVRQPLART